MTNISLETDTDSRVVNSAYPSIATNLPKHMPGLDGLRGIAILLVMWLHFTGHGNLAELGLYAKLSTFGQTGVDLFFVLSGFLITGILYDSKTSKNYYTSFYARRALRIFPLYYGVLAVYFLIIPFVFGDQQLGVKGVGPLQGWLWSYTTNLAICFAGNPDFGHFTHFWSLAVEEQFYLVWPVCVWLLSRKQLMWLCGVACVVIFLLRIPLESVTYFFTITRADSLLVGAWFALWLRRDKAISPAAWKLIWYIAIFSATVSMFIFLTKKGDHLSTWMYSLRFSSFAVLFGCLVAVAACVSRSSLCGRLFQLGVLRFFGKYSYGIYVYHGLFNSYLVRVLPVSMFESAFHAPRLATVLHTIAAILTSLAIAMCSYHLFELPILRYKRFFEAKVAV